MTATVASTTTARNQPVVLDGTGLTVAQIVAVARASAPVSIAMTPAARESVRQSAALKDDLVTSGIPIYGTTTGFGGSSHHQISADKAVKLQRNMLRYHLVGSGPEAPAEIVRATLLIRANCLARGVSGVRLEVIDQLVALLASDILPVVPERGSVGASGDLIPLCYLANPLTGQGEVRWRGRYLSAAEALQEAGITPLELRSKEALALLNGTSFMSAYAALAMADAERLADTAEMCTALAVQVLQGYRGHFASFPHSHKPHRGQVDSAATIFGLLEGAPTPDRLDSAPLTEAGYRQLPRGIQDPYSVRCAPHVIGVLRDTLRWVRQWVSTEINSANDNPLFDTASGDVHFAGNFYGGHIGHAMDSLKIAIASVGDLLDRQLALIVDEKYSNGLPANLAVSRCPDDPEAGLHHGFKGAQIAASALAAEAMRLASAPASMFSRSTETHNQDKVSMGTIAARDARTVIELVEQLTAIHLHVLCQAADLRGIDCLSPSTRSAYESIRSQVPTVEVDRRLDHDVANIVWLLRSNARTLIRQPDE